MPDAWQYLAREPETSLEWLPAYGPELSTEEQVQGSIKQHLCNATPTRVLS